MNLDELENKLYVSKKLTFAMALTVLRKDLDLHEKLMAAWEEIARQHYAVWTYQMFGGLIKYRRNEN